MKKLLKRLTPNAFRRLDDYFLRNYPTVWRTRIHIVLPLAVLAFPMLFAAGYFLPKNTFLEPLVDPIAPIEITQEIYFWIPFSFAVIAVLYWGFTQYQYKFDEVKPLKVIVILLMYGIGLFVILGLDATAFRLGTIARTTQLMDKDDLELVEGEGCFLYGFVFRENIDTKNETNFFEKDNEFSSLVKREDSILMNRYNLLNWLPLLDLISLTDDILVTVPESSKSMHRSDLLRLLNRSGVRPAYRESLSSQSSLLHLSSLSDLSQLSLLDRLSFSHLSDWSAQSSDMKCLFQLSSLSYLSSPQAYIKNRLDELDKLIKSNFYGSKLLSAYDIQYIKKNKTYKNRIINKYNLLNYDTIYIDSYVLSRIDTVQ